MRGSYAKVLDVVEDVVVEGEVTAGDAVDTSSLLDLPVGQAQALGLGEKVGLGDLSAPVFGYSAIRRSRQSENGGLTSLSGLLQVTELTHAGETENGRLNHLAGWVRCVQRIGREMGGLGIKSENSH